MQSKDVLCNKVERLRINYGLENNLGCTRFGESIRQGCPARAFAPSLHRMNVPKKMISVDRAMYRRLDFQEEMDGMDSDWHVHETGIRHGCSF